MKIKLGEGQNIRSGAHGGSCVQNSRAGFTLKNINQVRRFRSIPQMTVKQFQLSCVQKWRELTVESRTLWNLWATTYPQPTILNPVAYLSGYELFVKRNYYLHLFDPSSFDWMISPIFEIYDPDYLTATITIDGIILSVNCAFSLGTGHWQYMLFVSQSQSPGLSYGDTRWRYVGSITSENQTIDITDMYLSHFGVLPATNDTLFLSSVSCGADNGQFTFHQLVKLTVKIPEPPIIPVKFGLIYNAHCLSDSRLITSSNDWRIPDFLTDVYPWYSVYPPSTALGGKLKETGTLYWLTDSGASDLFGFHYRGAGKRSNFDGGFINLMTETRVFMKYYTSVYFFYLYNNSNNIATADLPTSSYWYGQSIRICRTVSGIANGTIGSYIGNDGRIYSTIVLNNREWLQSNLAETKWRNGSDIQGWNSGVYVPISNANWKLLTSSACCAYADDINNI